MNVPNMLSIFRLCLVPVFVVAYFSGAEHAQWYAVGIYAVATLTDYLDGHIARRYNLITDLGKVLDPLGDKMFTFSVLACITIDGIIPFWIVIIFVLKEALMGAGGIIIHKVASAPIPQSNIIGKTATVLFFLSCAALILIPDIPYVWAVTMMCVVLAVSMIALVSYVAKFLEIMKKKKDTPNNGEWSK